MLRRAFVGVLLCCGLACRQAGPHNSRQYAGSRQRLQLARVYDTVLDGRFEEVPALLDQTLRTGSPGGVPRSWMQSARGGASSWIR